MPRSDGEQEQTEIAKIETLCVQRIFPLRRMWLFNYHRNAKRAQLFTMYQTEKSLLAKIRERGRHHFSNKRGNQKSFFVFRLGKCFNQLFRKRKNGDCPS